MTLALHEVSLDVRDGASIRRVLRGVTARFEPRTFTALVGPSGSGKTSLLAVAAGLLAPTGGDVTLDGRSLVHLRERARASLRRSTLGLVLQDLALVPSMSVMENVLLPRVPEGVDAAARARAATLLGQHGLAGREDAKVATLSGGERQRVALVRALLPSPRILLLDEPSSSVDAEATTRLIAELARARDEAGACVVVASHDPRVVEDRRVDRRLRLVDGALEEGSSP